MNPRRRRGEGSYSGQEKDCAFNLILGPSPEGFRGISVSSGRQQVEGDPSFPMSFGTQIYKSVKTLHQILSSSSLLMTVKNQKLIELLAVLRGKELTKSNVSNAAMTESVVASGSPLT